MPGIRRVKWWDTKVGYNIPKEHDPDSGMQYCQSCLQYGIRSELKERVYRVDSSDPDKVKLVPEIIPTTDADRWRQCYRCGDITPIYNVKQESSLVDFVEPSLNPFDDNADKIGFTGRTSRLSKKKNKYAKKRDQISKIKDDDLKRELVDGQTQLIDYHEF
jgi:hypothetical protein